MRVETVVVFNALSKVAETRLLAAIARPLPVGEVATTSIGSTQTVRGPALLLAGTWSVAQPVSVWA